MNINSGKLVKYLRIVDAVLMPASFRLAVATTNRDIVRLPCIVIAHLCRLKATLSLYLFSSTVICHRRLMCAFAVLLRHSHIGAQDTLGGPA